MKPYSDIKDEFSKGSMWKIGLVFALTLAERAIFLAPAVIVGWVVDLVVAGETSKIAVPLTILAIVGIAQALFWPIRERFVASVVQSMVLYRSMRLTREVFGKSYDVFASSRVGHITKIVERAIEGFEQLLGALMTQALPALVSVFLVISYFAFQLPIGVPLLLLGAVLYFLISRRVLSWRREFLDDVNDAEDEIADSFASTFLAGRAIKSGGFIGEALAPLYRTYHGYADAAARLAFASGVMSSAQSAISLAITILAIIGGVNWIGSSNHFTAGDFVIVFSYVGIFMTNLGMVWKVREAFDDYDADSRAFQDVRNLPNLLEGACLPVHLSKPEIRVKYLAQDTASVETDSGDIRIPFGETVAVTGKSGAGKTTFIQSLIGIRASERTVELDGSDIFSLNQSDLSSLCDFAWQEPQFLFGNWDEAVFFRALSDAENKRARTLCEDLGIGHLFLPTEEDFRVDHLSGGEKRRLALLRVLAFPKPIVVLDEPTSELDAKYASAVVDELLKLAGNSTVIISSHDERLISQCSMQIEVDGGRLV